MRLPATGIHSVLVGSLLAAACGPDVWAQVPVQMQPAAQEVQTVVGARQALDQFCNLTIESIPPAMLGSAEGVAIFPNMIKGGFIFGVNYGRGVLLVRRPDRSWSPPVMVTMGGGSVGFQAGVQSADIVLVFATPRSLEGMLGGQKVTLGADASVALGPVGRQANAGTDARLGAEIYSYARSRGLFLGVSLGGADISVDHNANSMLYGRFGVAPGDVFAGRGLAMRPEVEQLMADLEARTRPAPTQMSAPTQAQVPMPQPPSPTAAAPAQAPLQAVPSQPAISPAASLPPSAAGTPPLVPIRQ